MLIQSVVCTLFEGHYYYGVVALANSLYKQGYRGDIYAGYRGQILSETNLTENKKSLDWKGSRTVNVADGLHLHFLPLDTDYHFTNYKPDYMLLLWNSVAKGAKQIFYFDPDITIVSPWAYFTKWVDCGVAVCEDVNSPLAENHPRRVAWRHYFSPKGLHLRYKDSIYTNGGFVGVDKPDFLILWKKVQELMASQIGGLNRSSLEGTPLLQEDQGPLAPFSKTDQDALNATIEAWDGTISFIGQEAMSFKAGSTLMTHALGQPKPWKKNFILSAFAGVAPSPADKAYWLNIEGPLHSYTKTYIQRKRISLSIASFIGRFYRRQ